MRILYKQRLEGGKNTIKLAESWSENMPALPDCRADYYFFCSFISLSESTALSKSPPDFQLLSLVALPDKQNLLDQADLRAAPAHMAASVAPSLSWGVLFPTVVSFMFGNHLFTSSVFNPNKTSSLTVFYPWSFTMNTFGIYCGCVRGKLLSSLIWVTFGTMFWRRRTLRHGRQRTQNTQPGNGKTFVGTFTETQHCDQAHKVLHHSRHHSNRLSHSTSISEHLGSSKVLHCRPLFVDSFSGAIKITLQGCITPENRKGVTMKADYLLIFAFFNCATGENIFINHEHQLVVHRKWQNIVKI